jgi:hypothetical protein
VSQAGQVLGLDLLESVEVHRELNPEMRGTSILVNSQFLPLFEGKKLKISTGKNTFKFWAKIVDCGDVRMTFLDNTIALKQLEKAHQVSTSYILSEKVADYGRLFPDSHHPLQRKVIFLASLSWVGIIQLLSQHSVPHTTDSVLYPSSISTVIWIPGIRKSWVEIFLPTRKQVQFWESLKY